jgi:hypothetical protein
MLESLTRRHFLSGFGATALAGMAAEQSQSVPHFAPKAKSVIYLHMSGGPSQLDLFDPKPGLKKYQGQDLPGSIRMGQRITGMTSGQSTLPVASSLFDFAKRGQAGIEMSDIIPWHHKIADDICLIRSTHTEAINHDPAITFIQTGFQQPGRPCIGSWVSYGLGSENKNLPSFVVMISQKAAINTDQPLFSRLWSSGFLPSSYQGVKFRAGSDPVLFLNDPDGMTPDTRRRILDVSTKLNQMRADSYLDPEIETRIAQYEMAFKMQTSVPDLMDLSKETESTYALYGEDAKRPGSFAQQCLLARRLVERGVRFVQLYNRGWDQHNDLPRDIQLQAKATDQASAALVLDLKQRGLLKDTLVVWGGEFGRTVYCQGRLSDTNYGRDHHPRCFSMWMAGGGIKGGTVIGETDDYSYNITKDPVHVHDIQATLLHCLGMDHTRLTYKFQGRYFRLTDVHGKVVKQALA